MRKKDYTRPQIEVEKLTKSMIIATSPTEPLEEEDEPIVSDGKTVKRFYSGWSDSYFEEEIN